MVFVLGVGAFLVAYNTIVNLRPLPRWTYLPVNLAVAAALVTAARVSGQTWEDLGLGASGLAAGIGWGLGLAVVVAAGMVGARWLASVVPALRALLGDRRAADLSPGRLAYDTLVRIPLGTAVCEEVFFRGVLFAGLLDVTSVGGAVIVSSILFGLWHVGPTLAALAENDTELSRARCTLVVSGAVAATTVGGIAFSVLRLASGSLSTPVVAHWACNAVGLLTAHRYQLTAGAAPAATAAGSGLPPPRFAGAERDRLGSRGAGRRHRRG